MTITLNGTNGITTPEVVLDNTTADGGQVVLKSSGYNAWNLDNYSGRLRGYYGSTEYFTVNSSGNVGIGTSNPLNKLTVGGNGVSFSNSYATYLANSYYDGSWKYIGNGVAWGIGNNFGGTTNGTTIAVASVNSSGAGAALTWNPAFNIDSGGNLLLGASAFSTVTAKSNVYQSAINNWAHQTLGVNYGWVNSFTSTSGGYAAYFQVFNGSSYVNVGNITTSGTATAYVTSSDYRLKENIQPMQNALAVVQQLNPVTYTWKSDGSDGQGFIAHELQAVVPDCVTGEKDAVDAEGNPVYQGIDTSFLVATLCKAIQELEARVKELESK